MDWLPNTLAQIAAVLVAIGSVLGIVLVQGRRARTEAERTRAETAVILEDLRQKAAATAAQVVNSHDDQPNLRDQIDGLSKGMASLRLSVGGIRDDMRQMRADQTQTRADQTQTRAELEHLRASVEQLQREDL